MDGLPLELKPCEADQLLNVVYKEKIANYPKFYKMDPLCKLGFVASELLLNAEGRRDEEWGERRGVLLFNATSSLADDHNYQKTIEGEDAFPSPSLFVYTLPNVVTGEIAIRNHFYGETNFMVLPQYDASRMEQMIKAAFLDPSTESLVTGWLDCQNESDFYAFLFIADRDTGNVFSE